MPDLYHPVCKSAAKGVCHYPLLYYIEGNETAQHVSGADAGISDDLPSGSSVDAERLF